MSALPSDFNSINRSDRSARKLASRETETTNSTLYECPQGRSASIESIWIANTTAISGDFFLYHVTPRETAGDDNAIMHHIAIDGRSMLLIEARIYMTSGDKLIFNSDRATCATVYGVEA